jgi:hypothetical protein
MASPQSLLPIALSLAALAASGAAVAQQGQPAEARVISSTPIRTPDGIAGYSVTYEYAGHQYTARTDSPPGATMPVQVTPMGVMTSAVRSPPPLENDVDGRPGPASATGPAPGRADAPWRGVTPERGVVVTQGGNGVPATTVYPTPAPVYVAPAPAPVYVAPAVYPRPYGWGGWGWGAPYGYGYGYAPGGISLNLGYTWYRR